MANFRIALSKVLKHEGGYVNDPADRGGETYRGISRKYWPNWWGWPDIDRWKAGDLARLHFADIAVEKLYHDNFWNPISGDSIRRQPLADVVFSCAVNMGVKPAARKLQAILGLKTDGIIGPRTLQAANAEGVFLIDEYCDTIAQFYQRLAERDPTQKRFLNGWRNRIDSYRFA